LRLVGVHAAMDYKDDSNRPGARRAWVAQRGSAEIGFEHRRVSAIGITIPVKISITGVVIGTGIAQGSSAETFFEDRRVRSILI